MPRLAELKVGEVRDLERQLVYAPPKARRRHMERAEALVAEIEPGRLYPLEFVVYRITGYRRDLGDDAVHLVAEALVNDLVTLIQRLSESLRIDADEGDRRAVRLDELPRRLGVSARTLRRYRRQGLVCHYVVFPDGMQRLACFEDALERFVSGHRAQLDRAASFTRVPEPVRAAIVAEARHARAQRRLSLNAAARRLAERHGRAHETVRAILKAHDGQGADPIFAEPGPLRARDARLIHRAVRLGIPVAALAGRYGKTRATIHRALNRRRAELLRGLALHCVELPTMGRPEAEPVVLGGPAVAGGLDAILPHADALELVAAAHEAAGPDRETELALVGGYALLKRRAARAIEALGAAPAATALDAVETDLRWAALVKRRLVCAGLGEALIAVERTIGRPLVECAADTITTGLRLAIDVVGEVVETFDPSRDRRLAHAAGFAANRRMASASMPASRGRAAARHAPGSMRLADPFGRLCAWQSWLELSPARRAGVRRLPQPHRELVERHYGLAGERPLSAAELGRIHGGTPSATATMIRRAEGSLGRADAHSES